jgi:hypothetical protein
MSRKIIIARAMAAAEAACDEAAKARKAGQEIPNRLGAFHGAAVVIHRQARIHDPMALRVAAAVLRNAVWTQGSFAKMIHAAAAVLGIPKADVERHYSYDVILALGAVRDLVWRTRASLAPCSPVSAYSLPTGPLTGRLVDKREALVRHAVESTLGTAKAGHPMRVVTTDDATAVGVQVRPGAWVSSPREPLGFRPSGTTVTITVARRWMSHVYARGLAVVDGMATLDAAPVGMDFPDSDVFAATWIRQGRGAATSVRGFIARAGAVTHHGLSLEEAIAGLGHKRCARDRAAAAPAIRLRR